jgi:hypothetical protein
VAGPCELGSNVVAREVDGHEVDRRRLLAQQPAQPNALGGLAGRVIDLEDPHSLQRVGEPVGTRVETGAQQHELVQPGLGLAACHLVDDLGTRRLVRVGARQLPVDHAEKQGTRQPVLGQRRHVETAEKTPRKVIGASHAAITLEGARGTNRGRSLGRTARQQGVAPTFTKRHAAILRRP